MPHSRDLDWSVVALDALGLILFFVPGVIAFVVDFATGAIYLPPSHYAPYPCSSYGPNPFDPPVSGVYWPSDHIGVQADLSCG
jgi:hypothetical protein